MVPAPLESKGPGRLGTSGVVSGAVSGAVWLASMGASAWGQSQTFELYDDGTWAPVGEVDPASDEGAIARARTLLAEDQPALAKRAINDWLEGPDGGLERGSAWVPHAYFLRADAKTMLGDEYDALFDYERVIKEYPESSLYARAMEREFEIALRYLAGLKRRLLGIRAFRAEEDGAHLLFLIQDRLPDSVLAERAGLELGDFYYRTGQIDLALEQYKVFLGNFPDSVHRPLAMARTVHASIARSAGPRFDASGLVEAKALIRAFSARYPAAASEAQLSDALSARIDEALAAKLLETARWYLRRDDPVSARLTLRRLLAKQPGSVAAAEATRLMIEKGWLDASIPEIPSVPSEPAPERATDAEGPP